MEENSAIKQVSADQEHQLTEAERLFAELLVCEPGPTFEELQHLFLTNKSGLSQKTVFAAIVAHRDFRYEKLDFDPLDRTLVLDLWKLVPLDKLGEKEILRAMQRLRHEKKFKDVRFALGQHLIALGKNLDQVVLYVPELKEEAWTRITQLEESSVDLILCVHHWNGDEKRQKIAWILEHRPRLAQNFIHTDCGNDAARIVLADARQQSEDALLKIIQSEQTRHAINQDLIQSAIRILLERSNISTPSLVATLHSSHASVEQKECVVDTLLQHKLAPADLLWIEREVPTRTAQIKIALAELQRIQAEQEAARSKKDRILQQLLSL